VKTTVGSENHDEQQLTGVIQNLKTELAENRMELERLRKDQFSYWRGSRCIAGTPGEAAYAEPARPAQFLDHQFTDMSAGSWRAPQTPPSPPAPPSVPFTGVNMSSPPPAVYGSTLAPYSVYPFPLGPDVPADPSSLPSGRLPKRRQSNNCYHCHQPGYFKAKCPQRKRRAQGASTPNENLFAYLLGWPR